MPTVKRNASLILYDVNCAPEFRKDAEKFLLNVCAMKWFSKSKDSTKLILLNTAETKNVLHSEMDRAHHIFEATDVIHYDPNLIKPHLKCVKTGEADWLVALMLAIQEYKTYYANEKGIVTMQILLISDFSNLGAQIIQKRVDFFIKTLKNEGIFLYIVGPKVKVPKQMSTVEDIRQWAKNIEFLEDGGQLNPIKNIVKNTNYSIVCDLELGQELFHSYKNCQGIQPWNVPLTAGRSITFPTIYTRFLRLVYPPSFKPQSFNSGWQWHLVDDVMITVPPDGCVGGVFTQGKFIPLPYDVEKNFKCYERCSFKIVGFTKWSNISDIYMCGEATAHVQASSQKFILLLHTLAKRNLCAVARKIARKNCKPVLVALLPNPEKQLFIVVNIPYKDDIPMNIIEQDLHEMSTLDGPTVKITYDYLEKLDVNADENKNESGSVKIPLNATLTNPIRLKLMKEFLLAKYTGDEISSEEKEFTSPICDFSSYLHLCPPRPPPKTKRLFYLPETHKD